MPRHSPPSPVTARARALLGIDVERRKPQLEVVARATRSRERAPLGWIPDPPAPVPGDAQGVEPAESGTRGESGRRGRHRPASGPALVTAPLSLRRARIHVSWQAVVALIVLAIIAALVFAVRVARAEQSAAPKPATGSTPAGVVGRTVPSAFATTGAASGGRVAGGAPPSGGAKGTSAAGGTVGGGAAGGGAAGGGAAGGGAGGAPQAAMSMVHVAGQVARPGVVTVAQGARVVDAITLAGGASPGADLQHVNLARLLVDGEQVYVPKAGEAIPAAPGPTAGAAAAGRGGSAAGPTSAVVNLNTADASALDGLPGLGPVLAQRIVDWRTEHGRFTSVDELGEVSGIGEKLLSQIRSKVTV
jgi:competence protein ComEA